MTITRRITLQHTPKHLIHQSRHYYILGTNMNGPDKTLHRPTKRLRNTLHTTRLLPLHQGDKLLPYLLLRMLTVSIRHPRLDPVPSVHPLASNHKAIK
jgi:hypothetical protein